MLNPNIVYFKTEAGIAEVKARALGLRAELRRLLILVDGNTPLSRLEIFVRGSEIDYLIAELEIQGLVATGSGSLTVVSEQVVLPAHLGSAGLAVPAVPSASSPARAPSAAVASGIKVPANLEPTQSQMLAVRRTAVETLRALLGNDGEQLVVKIERCKDAQELRVAVTDIRQTLDRQLGTETGQRFLDAVRSAAEGTR